MAGSGNHWSDDELEVLYVTDTDEPTLRDVEKQTGASLTRLAKLSKDREWPHRRTIAKQQRAEKATKKRVRMQADQLGKFHDAAFNEARATLKGLAKAREKQSKGGRAYFNGLGKECVTAPWGPDKWRAHASAIETCVKAGNLAMGQPTEIHVNIEEELEKVLTDLGDDPLKGAL